MTAAKVVEVYWSGKTFGGKQIVSTYPFMRVETSRGGNEMTLDELCRMTPSEVIEEVDRLRAENAKLRAALEEVRQQIYTLMPDGWSDAPYVISVIDRALNEETK